MNSSQKMKKSFSRWLLGHLTHNPLIIIGVIIGTAIGIFTRLLIPIILGEAIDLAIIDKGDMLSSVAQLSLLNEFVIFLIFLGISR
ncbi:MAG: hypothetical protein ACFFDC_09820, partial [Promethearchaeota archaeon]